MTKNQKKFFSGSKKVIILLNFLLKNSLAKLKILINEIFYKFLVSL